jgi:hypothetical protein
MTTTKISQRAQILKHLRDGNTITQLEALGVFRAYRLADIILKLRQSGWNISTNMKRDAGGTPYGEYKLENPYNLYTHQRAFELYDDGLVAAAKEAFDLQEAPPANALAA